MISSNEFKLNARDIYLLFVCIFREMRGGSLDEQRGVYWTIRNRATDPKGRWPKTVTGVIIEPWQFSSFNSHDPNVNVFPSTSSPLVFTIGEIVDKPGEDPTLGATHYIDLPEGKEPSWATKDNMTVKIGKTRFYKL